MLYHCHCALNIGEALFLKKCLERLLRADKNVFLSMSSIVKSSPLFIPYLCHSWENTIIIFIICLWSKRGDLPTQDGTFHYTIVEGIPPRKKKEKSHCDGTNWVRECLEFTAGKHI